MPDQPIKPAAKPEPTLGVVAICKNEEKDLSAFIEHLLPWVDEIVIVDDGSIDSSRDIIRAAGAKVHLVEHTMDQETGFSGLRNIGIDRATATADWLLHMDIDERVPPAFAAEIRANICHTRRNGFKYRRLNYFLHREMRGGGWQEWNKCQLARKGKHSFQNKAHEVCVIDGDPG
ncbi:MAG: glycosyltransferase family 2 protein [Desulfobacterales bacterium]|nr:glycosyltransferase family 2 protein [Desulfobacterales bacterium]